MGNIVFSCSCGQQLQMDEKFAGQQVKCPRCGQNLVAPAAGGQPIAVGQPIPGAAPMPLKPHRGSVVLTLGILGLLICVICGIIAWVMGNNDLREMAAGRMDRSGEGMTKAGKILGMIATILCLVVLGIYLIVIVGALGVAVSH